VTTVSGTITGPGGTAPAAADDRRVVITLVDLNGQARAGFTSDDHEIVAATEVTAATDGSWSVTLPGNASVDSDWGDTLYRVDAGYDADLRQPFSNYISVPASGSHWLGDIRVTPPGGAVLSQSYLPLAGGTLTGPLILAADPATALGAATKQYVDNTVAGASGGAAGVSSFNSRTGAVTLQAADIPAGSIVNASVSASAAIALSKLATDPLARANHTGTQTAATISDFDTQVRTSRLDQMAAPTAAVSLNSQRLTNLSAAVSAADAVTKTQLDGKFGLAGGNHAQLNSEVVTYGLGRVDLNYTATSSASDTLAFFYGGNNGSGGTRTGYHNEYGELRARPGLTSTVALRAMAHGSGSSGDVFQVADSAASTIYLGVSQTAAVFGVPVTIQGSTAAVDHAYSPADYGLLAWVGDPGAMAGSLTITAGIIHLLKIKLPKAITISNIVHRQSGGTISLTSGQNFAALFDTSGTQVAITADQTTNWGTAGYKTSALTAPYAAAAGFIYVAFLFNGSTPPNLPRYNTTATFFNNAGLAASALRFAQSGSGLTSMPSSITMSGLIDDATASFWAGVT
jgi:hypothetical protein